MSLKFKKRYNRGIMLYTLLLLLLLFWAFGFIANIGTGVIHILLVIALCVIVLDIITGRKI